MLSPEINDLLSLTGPGTPAGAFMRCYWQPVALADELPADRPVCSARVLSEPLVVFRQSDGLPAVLDRRCPHRGADLSYGRLEDGGIRCPFHGWLFDSQGRCLEQPAEPVGSTYHQRINQPSYPCIERNGVVFAYLGDGAPPPLPDLDCFNAPASHSFAFKGLMECNWLQALEVGIDPAHASFLHRFFADDDPQDSYGKQFRDNSLGSRIPMTRLLREHHRPEIRVEQTPYGLRIVALRDLGNLGMHVRVTNQVFPHGIVIPMSESMNITQWHVPIDDRHSYWYAMFTSFGGPVDQEEMRAQRLSLYELPDYRPRLNRSNRYGFDAQDQRLRTYTGMGPDINVHDQWAVESPGPIADRSREHLGYSDLAIRAYRKRLQSDISRLRCCGGEPSFRSGIVGSDFGPGPPAVDTLATRDRWEQEWRSRERSRRADCGWLGKVR